MACSQLQKVENDVHIKASAEQFHEVFCSRTYQIANICPKLVQAVEIHGGEWGKEGSINTWHYIHDGKACVSTNVLESVDWKNKKITCKIIDGDLLQCYKSFKFIMEVTPKGNGNEVHWILEYEKKNDNMPDPHTMLQLTADISKEIDAYLAKNHK